MYIFNPKLLIYPSLLFPFGNHKFVFYICGSISILYRSSLVSVFTYRWYMMLVSVWLTSLCMIISRSNHVATNGIISFFFFLWLSNVDWVYIYTGGSVVKKIYLQCRRHRRLGFSGKIPWSRKWQPTPVFLPAEFHGQRSLAVCSPWGCKELDPIEATENICIYTHCILKAVFFSAKPPPSLSKNIKRSTFEVKKTQFFSLHTSVSTVIVTWDTFCIVKWST